MPVLPQEPRRPVAPAPAEIETPAEQAQQQDAWPAPAAVMPAEPASAAPSQAQAPVSAPAASSADADTTAQSVPVPAASEEHIDESTRAFLEMNGMLAPEPVREPGAEAASEAAESEPADQQAQPQPEVAAPEVQAPAITPQLEERPAPAPVVQQPAPQPAPADVEPASARPDAQAASGRVRRQAAPANFELEKTAEHAPVRSTTTTISARRRPEDRGEQNAPSQVFKAERPESRRPVRAAAPAPAPADEIEDEATPFETADDTSAYERDDQYPYDEQREDDTYVADAYEDEDEWPEEQKESWGTRLKKRFQNFRANHRRDKDVEGVDDEDAFYDEEQEQPVDYVDEREQPASETDLQDYEDYQNDDDDESYVEEDFDAEAEVIVAEITGKHKPVVLDELDQPEKTAELSPVSPQDEEASAAAVRQSVPAEDEGGSQADSDVEAAAYDEPREAPARQEGQAMRPQSEPQEALEGDAGSDSDEAHGTETAPDAQEESDVQFASEPADDHREPEGAREVEAVEKRPRHIPEVRTEQPRERQRSGDRKPTPRKSVRDRNIPHVGITGEMSPVNGRRPTRKNQRLAGIPQVERPDDVERVPSRPAAEQANFEASAAEDVERVAPASTSSSRPAGEDRRSRRHSRRRAEEDAWEDLADGADISDDDWKGGAASTHDPTAAAREKMRKDVAEMATREAPAKRPPKEVWFLAVGASEQDNAGVKAFLAAHADELRGATFINLRAVGAGTLAALKSEGVGPAGARSDHRSQTLARRAAKASGHELELRDAPAFVTDAVPVLHSRHRAITLMAFDGSAPVAWEQSGDTSDVLEENTIRAAADIVEKMVR
ncbi:MAG: M28 family peptidase [Coriobacteriales bacterium]